MSYRDPNAPASPARVAVIAALSVLALVIVVSVGVGGCAGLKAFKRAQARADANNRVAITKIEIRNQDQQAKVVAAQNGIVRAQAQQRYLAAVGVRQAQDEIRKTLTPLYVQWDAIQALLKLGATGRNNTVVYLPSGPAGVPLVTANGTTGK